MDASVANIPLANLALAFIPVAILLIIMLRWSINAVTGIYAVARMLLQLVVVGFALTWIFTSESAGLIAGLLSIMLCAAAWIALRPLTNRNWQSLVHALIAIALSGGLTLLLITQFVLSAEPWFEPRIVIPLGGMIFASAMNTVSLAAERLQAELGRATNVITARQLALKAALIPLLNSLLAVGLVSLPGMMTGQVLSGIEPLIAIRYQIMVMCMLTGAAGIAAALYLLLATRGQIPE
jgi:putative ABC transport system permease protein